MKIRIALLLPAFVMAFCHPSKKATQTAGKPPLNPAAAVSNTVPANTAPAGPSAHPPTGVYAPGETELAAIRQRFPDVTMETLKQGHALYTGVCTNCHQPKNIYSRPEGAWPEVLADMAHKAKISDSEKDAVYKYVIAVKAAQGQ